MRTPCRSARMSSHALCKLIERPSSGCIRTCCAQRYAEFAGVSEQVAQRLRDGFFTKDMVSPDKIVGIKAIMKDAVTLRYIQTTLSRTQIADLIQIPPPVRDGVTG